MKQIRNIFIALGISCAVSCGNGWLDLEPSTAINTDEAVKTLKEVEFTMNGIYDIMRSSDLYSGRMMYYGDVTGDDMQAVSSSKRTGNYYRFSFTRDNGPSSHWAGLYEIIQNTNLILGRVDGIRISDDEAEWRDNLKGEALAIRAQRYAGMRKASLLSSDPNRIPCRKESQFTTISSTKSQADTAGLRKAM